MLQLCAANGPAKFAEIRRSIDPVIVSRHLQRAIYASGVGYVLHHPGQRDLDIVIAGPRRRQADETDRSRQFVIDPMRQFPKQQVLTEQRFIARSVSHRIMRDAHLIPPVLNY